MSKVVVESEDVEVVHAYLEHLRTTRARYEIEGGRVSLQTKRYDNSGDEAPEVRAARARWSARKEGTAHTVPGGFLRLCVRGERDVFYRVERDEIVRPTRYELRLSAGRPSSAQQAWRDALAFVERGLRHLVSTFEGRELRFALEDDLADRLRAFAGQQKRATVSSNTAARLRVRLLREPPTLRFEVDDPGSTFIWDARCDLGDELALTFGGATVDAAAEGKLKRHRKTLRPEDLT